ncbi:MAG: HigA family addiction module antidote protein [Treponema sp.]|jgi:addiction module HigA family antidote|nr:HigA family addiction module antidote protein [Treponema sp.]
MAKSVTLLPGKVLKEKFMEPYQLKSTALAKEIGVYPAIISNVLNNKQRITIPLGLRLAKFFKTTEKYWTDLQFNYDYEQAVKDSALKAALKGIRAAVKPKKEAAPAGKKTGKAAPQKKAPGKKSPGKKARAAKTVKTESEKKEF